MFTKIIKILFFNYRQNRSVKYSICQTMEYNGFIRFKRIRLEINKNKFHYLNDKNKRADIETVDS